MTMKHLWSSAHHLCPEFFLDTVRILFVYCTYTGSTLVIIHVLDINDNEPQLMDEPYSAAILESEQPGTQILTIHAKDADLDKNAALTYSILNSSAKNKFTIDHYTGLHINSISKSVGLKP